MLINIAPTSLDTDLSTLLNDVESGKIQLPEFQRGWTWDDRRIRGILASLTQGYPMGAIMRLQYGNPDIRFSYRTIEGVKATGTVPEYLVLDGQQRLTSMYRSTHSSDPVETVTEQKKTIHRYYYLNINKCLDESEDRIEAIVSVPDDKKIKTNFDRDIVTDLSTAELEYKEEMFPVNIIFDSNAREDWADGYKDYYGNTAEIRAKYKRFRTEILDIMTKYKLPVITLDKSTPREAVCKVFEDVNTGGVPLTVFELVTAMFASYVDPQTQEGFKLREDWNKCKDIIRGRDKPTTTDVMDGIDESTFLTAVTLYSTYQRKKLNPDSNRPISCKRKDVLSLQFADYQEYKGLVLEGFRLTQEFLYNQYVFKRNDLPYTTQLIPLAVICAIIGRSTFNIPKTQRILEQWFWCGILGEMYGGANETRYALDVEDVVNQIMGQEVMIRTVNDAHFSATRLLSMQTRNSAAYKGIMALLYKAGCKDFIKGTTMNLVISMAGSPDIHHIFPEAYCSSRYERARWNSIINKTPILYETNRAIGGHAPSVYSKRIIRDGEIDDAILRERLDSHHIDADAFLADDFDTYFIARAKRILALIEKAMGKQVSDKGSEQTIKAYGCSLATED